MEYHHSLPSNIIGVGTLGGLLEDSLFEWQGETETQRRCLQLEFEM